MQARPVLYHWTILSAPQTFLSKDLCDMVNNENKVFKCFSLIILKFLRHRGEGNTEEVHSSVLTTPSCILKLQPFEIWKFSNFELCCDSKRPLSHNSTKIYTRSTINRCCVCFTLTTTQRKVEERSQEMCGASMTRSNFKCRD
jgi:hypothetical protein